MFTRLLHLLQVSLLFLCDGELDLGHVRVIILAYRLRDFQVDFVIGANHRVAIGLDPPQESFVCLHELVERPLVNDAGHRGSGKLVDSDQIFDPTIGQARTDKDMSVPTVSTEALRARVEAGACRPHFKKT